MSFKKSLIKTNRIHLVFGLHSIIVNLPISGTIEDWCLVAEDGFKKIGYETYCHKSAQINLIDHARKYGEFGRAEKALYHCDMQHDISMLNRDTSDPSGANTDPLFPREEYWIFQNIGGTSDYKSINSSQIEKCFRKYQHIQLDSQYMISSDGHKCLSSPELFIEEFFISNGIMHIKEGDIDKDNGKRLTAYPYDEELNSKKRSKEADWLIKTKDSFVFVEYFEGRMDKMYLEKVEIKKIICSRSGIRLIELWRMDLTPEKLSKIFQEFI